MAGLSDDLNIAEALSALFEMVREVNGLIASARLDAAGAAAAADLVRDADEVLAVLPPKKEDRLTAGAAERIEARQKARRDRDFALADRLRDELLEEGIVLEDTKDGVRWKRIKPAGPAA
jgi:cysteinyl-tRNA synthetase